MVTHGECHSLDRLRYVRWTALHTDAAGQLSPVGFLRWAELDENRFVLSVVNCLVRLLQLRAILHLDLGYETEVLATQSHIWFPKRNQQHQAEVQQKPLKTFLI